MTTPEPTEDEITMAWVHTMDLCNRLYYHIINPVCGAPTEITKALKQVGDWIFETAFERQGIVIKIHRPSDA